jgi:LytS/YehU family sensor histidine kinase
LEIAAGLALLAASSLIFFLLFLDRPGSSADGNPFWQEYGDGVIKFGILSLVIVFVYAMMSFSIFSYNQYSKYQIEQVRVERHQMNLQFEALRSQLSPHFLFNALNTISSLIYRDIHLAEDFIRRMAHSYRYILGTNDRKLVSLRSELEMLKAYFFMQKIKFESCVDLAMEVPERLHNSLLPPLTRQMLIENAMKHNLICEEKKLVVSLEAEDGYLVVRNNIIPKPELLKIGNNLVDRPSKPGSHKIGLNNIRNRYAFFIEKKIVVIINKDFIVKLPIIFPREQSDLL